MRFVCKRLYSPCLPALQLHPVILTSHQQVLNSFPSSAVPLFKRKRWVTWVVEKKQKNKSQYNRIQNCLPNIDSWVITLALYLAHVFVTNVEPWFRPILDLYFVWVLLSCWCTVKFLIMPISICMMLAGLWLEGVLFRENVHPFHFNTNSSVEHFQKVIKCPVKRIQFQIEASK